MANSAVFSAWFVFWGGMSRDRGDPWSPQAVSARVKAIFLIAPPPVLAQGRDTEHPIGQAQPRKPAITSIDPWEPDSRALPSRALSAALSVSST